MPAGDQVSQWWSEIPCVARWHFAGAATITLAVNFGAIGAMQLALLWDNLVAFKLWVLVTNFMMMGKLGFPFLMHMVFLHQYSKKMESILGTIDYLFMLLFCMMILVVSDI